MSVPSALPGLFLAPVALETVRPAPGARTKLSVIIPLASAEAEPQELLAMLPPDCEVILARGGTRATSMNRAAAIASGDHLWFVHADTTLEQNAIRALEAGLTNDDSIRYFDLRFDGGALMRLTELGVLLRSRLFGTPFGDQALCLSSSTFRSLGGYDERAIYGEDHLLVRKAHRQGFAVKPIGATILTSGRKYRQNGWFRTTWLHLRLTIQQVFLPL